jgi:hypothetical protein
MKCDGSPALLLMAAVRNNAEWCDTISRAHGVLGAFAADAWTSPLRTPMYYPDAITLSPTAKATALLRAIDASRGCSVKDSFATLDLVGSGMRVLFEAMWIARAPDVAPERGYDGVRWARIQNEVELAAWHTAMSGNQPSGLFPPTLLADHRLAFLSGYSDDKIIMGAVANKSGSVVGMSNVFGPIGASDRTWAGATAAVMEAFQDVPIVGYERGEALDAARRQAFAAIGPLRVWIKD